MIFIISFMWMWSRVLQNKLSRLMAQIEIDDLTGAYRKSFMIELIENFRTGSPLCQRSCRCAKKASDKRIT